MSEERPTPRTDAEALWPASNDGSDTYEPGGAYVTSDFARELERESDARAEMIAELEAALKHLDEKDTEIRADRKWLVAENKRVESENAKLREDLKDAVDALEMVRDADDDSIKDELIRWCTSVARCRIDKVIAKFYGKEPS